jgi:hypothetical protein
MHLNHTGPPTPEQRRGEIARILAAGVLRLRARAALPAATPPPAPQILSKSGANCLEVVSETRLTVHPS